jgi:hypothetical protein
MDHRKTHELKTDPESFDATWAGLKKYEVRFNDRNYQIGDWLRLCRTKYSSEEMKQGLPLEYTPQTYEFQIRHILTGPVYGLKEGWVILS